MEEFEKLMAESFRAICWRARVRRKKRLLNASTTDDNSSEDEIRRTAAKRSTPSLPTPSLRRRANETPASVKPE